jgi:hypothetical protein
MQVAVTGVIRWRMCKETAGASALRVVAERMTRKRVQDSRECGKLCVYCEPERR